MSAPKFSTKSAISVFIAVCLTHQESAGAGIVAAAADAAANFDDYKTAPNGLKWLDTQEGSGPPPVKGANIR